MNTNAQVQHPTLGIFRESGRLLRDSAKVFRRSIPVILTVVLAWVSIFYSLKSPGMFVIFRDKNNVKTLKVTFVKTYPACIPGGSAEKTRANKATLYDMGREVEAIFWMKETSFPLSAAFLDRKGKVLAVYNMKPFAEIQARPPSKFRYVVEAGPNWFSSNGIKKGTEVILPPTP